MVKLHNIHTLWSKFRVQIPYLPRTLKLIWKASGKLMIFWIILTVIQGLLPVVFIYLIRPFIDHFTKAIGLAKDAWNIIYNLLPEITLIVSVLFLTESLKSITKWISIYQGELVREHIQTMIHKKSLEMDMAFFESADFYDKLYRAKTDSLSRPVALLENLGDMIKNLIILISILSLLFVLKWWLPVVLIFGVLPTLPFLLKQTLKFHHWNLRVTLEKRKERYYDFLLTERESAAELRLFNLGDYFQGLFVNISKKLRNEYISITRQEMFTELFIAVWMVCILGCVMLWILLQAVSGKMSLGIITMFYMAFDRSQKSMNSLISNVTEVYKNIMFIENLFQFVDIQPKVLLADAAKAKKFAINNSIKFNNVSFVYPFSAQKALDNLTLEIPAGKITAIVGTNGAGKSTLIKLLCRFYDPTSGTVEADGTNYTSFSQKEIQRNLTVLFQEYLRFHMKVFENIGLGNYGNQIPDLSVIETAAQEAGADRAIELLPEKYQTVLGRWFSGSELSTGEWQRMALARVFLRKAPFIIFDEPTSAMDSWAEADWLQRFKQRVKGSTALIITHRFTTAMQADIIYVMDKGKVTETGTHQGLMALNGQYALSWLKQTKMT